MAHLYVIAGHGAGDPGACANGYQEAERVRALAAKIKAYGGSNVTVGDTSRDWYADNGISSLNISKDTQIIELHMDSAVASARGGHVIIKSGYNPDKYDTALANYISSVLPGRSQTIVKRSDLANPKRAAAKGYPYRLLECGFISNAADVQIFNSKIDDIAKGILSAFDIMASGSGSTGAFEPANPGSSSSSSSAGTSTNWTGYVNTPSGVNVRTGAGTGTGYGIITAIPNGTKVQITKESGGWGYDSSHGGWVSLKYIKKGSSGSSSGMGTSGNWVARLQSECNKQGFSNQKVDGIAGKNTLAGCPTVRRGASGNITRLIQEKLISLGYSCGSSGIDGKFGSGTESAVKAFQKARNLSADGIVGQKTWRKLLNM